MLLKSAMAFAAALLCSSGVGKAEEGWGQLKAGMTRVDAVSTLGTPLFKNLGRGFELWIYDRGAEVVCFRGTLVAWTAPGRTGGVEGRQLDLRSFLKAAAPPAPVGETATETAPSANLAPVREMRLPHL
ncbi:MAG: hypothetical protein ABIZ04_10650 [Opitutus sp.]